MLIKDLSDYLESWAPLSLQESYDNCGLLTGQAHWEAKKALISLDVTEAVLEEAILKGCNIIIAHHPLIFGGLKRINGNNSTERIVIQAIKNDIAIYAIHTNLDNVQTGVNRKICDKIGIRQPRILGTKRGLLRKLITFCPEIILEDGNHAPEQVRQALWQAGAGHIGQYDQCSFNEDGMGTYRALEGAKPFIGTVGENTRQAETKIEMVFPAWKQRDIIRALMAAHPYEEVAYDIIALENELNEVGAGMVGELEEAMEGMEFLQHLKTVMQSGCVRYTTIPGRKIKRVAVCGGSGQFLLKDAISAGADAFVSADFKYHQFFDAEQKILIADIGHFESEQYTRELIYEKLTEKFPNFALLISNVNTNPINYL